MAVIVDTSVLYALTDRGEPSHAACVAALEAEREAVVVPQPILAEICYLVGSRLGTEAEIALLRGLVDSDWQLEPLEPGDLPRVVKVMETYADADIGFVDAAVVGIAERLSISRIYTHDRRDFGLVHPTHTDAFEVLP